jgi:NADPH-dependent glutamate synthase beta subunit-like oxidoreductase
MSETFCPKLPHEEIERNFREIAPALTEAEALFEANRCVYCYDAPCTHACPTHIDVPAFIKKIASGNLVGSARVIFDANPIGATCARVCPVEVLCEGACVENTLMHKPIEIGRLQRYATDFVLAAGLDVLKAGAPNGKSVGVVGSGPAGLSCATYLARLGPARRARHLRHGRVQDDAARLDRGGARGRAARRQVPPRRRGRPRRDLRGA